MVNAKRIIGRAIVFIFFVSLALGIYVYKYIDSQLSLMYGGETLQALNIVDDKSPSSLVIRNVNVLSESCDKFLESVDVYIKDGFIHSLESTGESLSSANELDGTGRFLIPGLTDSHVHLWKSENDLLLYLINGVTQIREMNGSLENLRWKKEIVNGERIGPDMFVASPQIASFRPGVGWFSGWTQNKINAVSKEDFLKAVKNIEKQGYDAIKVSSMMASHQYSKLIDAAEKSNKPVIGHYPYFGELENVFEGHQEELSHVEEITKSLRSKYGYTIENADGFLEYVRREVDDISIKLLENNIHVTSTVALIEGLSEQVVDVDQMLSSNKIEYVNPGILEGTEMADRALGWLPNVNRYRLEKEISSAQRDGEIKYFSDYANANRLVFSSLLKVGVPIMAGTDANVSPMVPGFSMHRELEVLVDLGMTPSQAICSATKVPAKWFVENVGAVAKGNKANLILLASNPLEDISNTSSINTVILGGKIFEKSDLEKMANSVLDANNNSRKVDLSKWVH